MRYFGGVRRLSVVVTLTVAAMIALAACGSSGSGGYGAAGGTSSANGGSSSAAGGSSSVAVTGENPACAAGAEVCVKSIKVNGKSETVLADTKGFTLYYFTPDTATTVACTGNCAKAWPPLMASGASLTGTDMSGSLTTVNGANGAQVVYNGHPLYRFATDKDAGDDYGEGLLGKWFVATPTLSANGSSATPTQGAGGY